MRIDEPTRELIAQFLEDWARDWQETATRGRGGHAYAEHAAQTYRDAAAHVRGPELIAFLGDEESERQEERHG